MANNKDTIRKEILERLRRQSKEEKRLKSDAVKNRLFSSEMFKKARAVMFYVSKEEEVDTHRMIDEALRIGKRVAVPYYVSETSEIKAKEIRDQRLDLELGPYGIYQPREDASIGKIPIKEIDLVIVPGVAFDEKNNRLGRGKGCYDRFLRKLSPGTKTIGLCFDFQIVGNLPKDSSDFLVHKVISN